MRAEAQRQFFTLTRIDWATPPDVFDALDDEFDFTLDPCATAKNATCERFFTIEQDGLRQSWAGESVYMNPPYGRGIGRWTAKAASEAPGTKAMVGLVPARTDTAWWHDDVVPHADVRFLRGRLKFGGSKVSAPFPSAVVVWWPR